MVTVALSPNQVSDGAINYCALYRSFASNLHPALPPSGVCQLSAFNGTCDIKLPSASAKLEDVAETEPWNVFSGRLVRR